MMSAYLQAVCLTVRGLCTCRMPVDLSDVGRMSVYLQDIFTRVGRVDICRGSAYLYDVCIPLGCLYTCRMSVYLWPGGSLYSSTLYMHTCRMSPYQEDVCMSVGRLQYVYVCIPVGCLRTSVYTYTNTITYLSVCSPIRWISLQVRCSSLRFCYESVMP